MAYFKVILNHGEIEEEIPYKLICETRYGAKWGGDRQRHTLSKVQRKYREMFSEEEQREAAKLFVLAHKWYLSTGTPDEYEATPETLELWKKLGEFCTSV